MHRATVFSNLTVLGRDSPTPNWFLARLYPMRWVNILLSLPDLDELKTKQWVWTNYVLGSVLFGSYFAMLLRPVLTSVLLLGEQSEKTAREEQCRT